MAGMATFMSWLGVLPPDCSVPKPTTVSMVPTCGRVVSVFSITGRMVASPLMPAAPGTLTTEDILRSMMSCAIDMRL